MRQRLVGTLVLGCLAIILIPLLLDGEGIEAPPLTATIPPTPQFDATPIDEPTRPLITADTLPAPGSELAPSTATVEAAEVQAALPAFEGTAAPTAPPPTAATATPATATATEADALEAAVAAIMAKKTEPAVATADSVPRLDSSGLPLSYVVRLGSFSEKANADGLVKKLLAAEYKAYIRTLSNASGPLTAVYVGPVLTRAEANTLLNKLASTFELNGAVETFTAQTAQ
jgi:DedD protein